MLGNLENNFPKLHLTGTSIFTGNRETFIGGEEEIAFESLLLNSSGKLQLQNNVRAKNLTIKSGTFDLGNYSIEGQGNFTLDTETTLQLRGTQRFPAPYNNYYIHPASTVEYRGALQNITAVPGGFGNLLLTGFDRKIISENITVNTNFIFDVDVDGKNSEITIKGNWINQHGDFYSQGTIIFSGEQTTIQGAQTVFHNIRITQNAETILEQNISADNIEVEGTLRAKEFAINVSNNFQLHDYALLQTTAEHSFGNFSNTLFSPSSIVEFARDGEQNIPNLKYGHIRFASSGEKLVAFHLIANEITIASGATLNSQYFPVTITGNWNNSGIFISTSEVIFQGSDQIISSSTFPSIRFNGNGTKSATGNIIVTKDISINNGVIFDGGSHHHSIAGNWNNDGTFLSSGVIEFNGNGQTISSSTFNSIIFSGNGIKNITGNISIGGNVHILPNAKVSGNNYLFTIYGNWKNEGTFNSKGEVNFAGDMQTISSTEFSTLHFSGTGNKIALGNLTVLKNFTVDNGTQFSSGEFTHYIGGNVIAHQNISEETSTYIFNGSTPQFIPSLTLYNVEIENSSGVFLNGQLTILNNLKISTGDLHTENSLVEIGMNAALSETPGNRIIGKVFSLRPITIGETQNFGNIGFELIVNGSHPGPTLITRYTGTQLNGSENFPESQSIQRYFVVTPTENQNLNAQIVLHYDEEELQNQNEQSFDIWMKSGLKWKKNPVKTHRNTDINTDTINNISSLSLFTFADSDNPLFGATIKVKKIFDFDGDSTTRNDRTAKSWQMEIRSGSPVGNLIGAVLSDSVLQAEDIAGGLYIVSQADSFGWNNLGYRINGQFVLNPSSAMNLFADNGMTTEIEFISYHRNSVIINNVWDTDGDIATIKDRRKKLSRIELLTDSTNSTVIATAFNDSLLLLTDVLDGNYFISVADTGNWKRLGYSINGNVVISNSTLIPITLEERKILTIDVMSFFPNKILVKKLRDPDGNIYTNENRELQSTSYALYSGPPEPEFLITTTPEGEGFAFNNLGNGNYTLVELTAPHWKPLAYSINGATIYQRTNEIAFTLQGGNIFDVSFISYLPNTIRISHFTDDDGNATTTNDRTPFPWNFSLYKDSVSNATKIAELSSAYTNIDSLGDGTYYITRFDSAGFVSLGYVTETNNSYDSVKKSIAFSLIGGGKKFDIQFISYVSLFKKYRTFSQEKLGGKALALRSTQLSNPFGTRMPTMANIRDSIFKNYITPKLGAIILGVEQASKEKQREFGWIKLSKSQKKFAPHTSSAASFSHKKEIKNPLVTRVNNKLAGELYALKLAIAASDFGMIPTGLGEIIFDDENSANNNFNGKTLREIAPLDKAGWVDSLLTYAKENISSPLSYDDVYTVLHKINHAFDGAIDTLSTDPLLIKGTIPLADISFLKPSLVQKPDETVHSVDNDIPKNFFLGQNYPNPFNPSTTFNYTLASPSIVTIKIFNLLGQEVARIMNNEEYPEGTYQIDFNAGTLSSGIYFYRLSAIPTDINALPLHLVEKMVLIK